MASEPRPDQPPPSPKTSGDAEPRAPPPRKAPLGLLGLTEEATLELLSRLDMVGLATVRRVCRRLHRIASDPSLLARVSVVQCSGEVQGRRSQWLDESVAGPWFRNPDAKVRVRTNCAHLGRVQMPGEAEAARKKFLSLLEWLLTGGAELASLQMPGSEKFGDVLPDLAVLLREHEVELEELACLSEPTAAFLEVVRSQPTITHLYLPAWRGWTHTDTDETEAAELVRCLPGLRHLSLTELCIGIGEHWARPGLPEALAAQLRSVLVVSSSFGLYQFFHSLLVGALEGIREASAGRLLLRAVGHSGQGRLAGRRYVAFAVEDFRAEERGRRFLAEGKLRDPWDFASVALPEPTLDDQLIEPFLEDVEERHYKRQKAQEKRERRRKEKADGKKSE